MTNKKLLFDCGMVCLIDVLDDLMGFFLTLFDGLLSEISPALIERMTQTFMTLLTR